MVAPFICIRRTLFPTAKAALEATVRVDVFIALTLVYALTTPLILVWEVSKFPAKRRIKIDRALNCMFVIEL